MGNELIEFVWQRPVVLHAFIALVLALVLTGVSRKWPATFEKLPPRAQAFPAMVLGALVNVGMTAGTEGLAVLTELAAVGLASLLGVFDGLLAVGMHHTRKRMLPGSNPPPDARRVRRRASPVMLVLLLALFGLLPGLTSCSMRAHAWRAAAFCT